MFLRPSHILAANFPDPSVLPPIARPKIESLQIILSSETVTRAERRSKARNPPKLQVLPRRPISPRETACKMPNIEFTRIRYPRAKPRGTRVANSRSLTLPFRNQRTPISLSVTILAHETHSSAPSPLSKIPLQQYTAGAHSAPEARWIARSVPDLFSFERRRWRYRRPSPRRACVRGEGSSQAIQPAAARLPRS
ncbi:hypothetical protein K505DRAFT_115698 [Melanomma pulvis-pyrius CBS 109.77]|uniref:Uncharacterized protein n=1 Tax=Melanomma pulvis-pyrius CBS 109.77 TaxID=1314802 RepID=A0A6A6WW62_9PLEO|nr:hypothetical protein K505DRAFT_115698 [Melanomma pulvis-pyrius CBS 109.77]